MPALAGFRKVIDGHILPVGATILAALCYRAIAARKCALEQETGEDQMNINKILNELRSEKEEVERPITALERVGGKRRGRPPQWMKALEGHMARRKKPSKNQGD
jgi:hypothetical protein